MKTNTTVAVWDSCVIISAIQEASEQWPDAERNRWSEIEPYMQNAERGDFRIVVPESVVAEVSTLRELQRHGVSVHEQASMIQGFFENPYIVRRPIHRAISQLAAEIARTYRVKRVGDSLVLATAIVWNVQTLHTYDEKLAGLDGQLALSDGRKLAIGAPNIAAGTIFDMRARPEQTLTGKMTLPASPPLSSGAAQKLLS